MTTKALALLMAHVRAFHFAFSHPAPPTPTDQPDDRRDARADWIESEVVELRDATTIVDKADAYLDIIYFGVGGLVELGLDPSPLWDIVHGANMGKLWPDGEARKNADGKVMKPPGWVAPEPLLAAEVERQIALARP